MVVRGVPHRLAKDAWWLDDCDPPRGLRAGPVLLVVLLVADILIWDLRPGVGLALWFLALGAAISLTMRKTFERAQAVKAGAVLVLAVLPLIEVVQFSTLMVAILGLLMSGIIMATKDWDAALLWRAVRRIPGFGLVQTVRDAFAMRVSVPDKGSFRSAFFDWALPVGVGGVFVVLLIAANPLLDQFLLQFAHFEPSFLPRLERVIFWGFIAVAIWPLLRLPTMMPALRSARPSRLQGWRSGFLNERSVSRALVVFNLIFLIQTMLDLGYLWGGVALPAGMTYAEYAHRGAYPLLATALLAGVFAIMAQPYLGKGGAMCWLLYLWILQNVVLVVSSILRLDLYVDVYGLTRLRIAAFVWMVVVALGLLLIVMQLVGRHPVGWFLQRAFGLGLLAVYLCNLVNIDGHIARHNLADNRPDDYYLCQLSEGAIPAIRAHEKATGQEICGSYRRSMRQRDDWREWGYRNARLHRSLAAMEIEL